MGTQRIQVGIGMVKLLLFLSAVLVVSMLCSCASKVPFTASLKSQYGMNEKTLKKVQFYTSQEIVLTQSDGNSSVQTVDGKILVNSTARENRIVIPKNTPCTIEQTLDSTRIKVAFEYGEDKVLIFGVNTIGCYSLLAKRWIGKDGFVEYNNSTYMTENSSGSAYLTVKLKKLNQYRNLERKVGGKRI